MVRGRPVRFHPYLACVLLCSGCIRLGPQPAEDPAGAPAWTSADPSVNPFLMAADDTALVGLRIRLSEPTPADRQQIDRLSAAEPRTLAAATADSLLTLTFGEPPAPEPVQGYAFPTKTLPAPRPGVTTTTSFGDMAGAEATAPSPGVAALGPLRVIASGPRGEVATASQISISFSRPIVPLSALSEAAVPPVRLSPTPPGEWRWLDPSTLVFEGAGALPKATRYTVEVPAEIAAADGKRLQIGRAHV